MELEGSVEVSEAQNTDLVSDVQRMTENLHQVRASLVEAQEVVDNYQILDKSVIALLTKIQQNGPAWITALTIVLTIMLVWLAIAQVGLFLQGIELVRRR